MQVDSVLTSYYDGYKYIGIQQASISDYEYSIGYNNGLLFINGWVGSSGKGYCQLYLISRNPRQGYAVATLVAYGGETTISSSIVTSNYAPNKIKVTTNDFIAIIRILGFSGNL